MIYDILEAFEKEYKEKGENLLLASYKLKDGLYIKIRKDKSLEFYEAKNIKGENSFTDLEGNSLKSETLDFFKARDYYSSYINSNKCLFDKKIHNINYLSYFFKAENLLYAKGNIDIHFSILQDFSKFKSKQEKEILSSFKELLEDEIRKNDIEKKRELLKDSFNEITKIAKEKNIKNYIRIFFEEDEDDEKDLEIYKRESNIYLALKIFNDNSFNQNIHDLIYGLSNSNMGLNAKKPFLENKTRKFQAPFMIKSKDALMLKKFFDWLKAQAFNEDRTLDEHFFIQKQSKNDEAEITDFDYIPLKENDVQKYFQTIEVQNYLKITKDKSLISDYEISELFALENIVDKIFYNKQLRFNYYKDEIKISSFLSKNLQNLLYITRNSMINYFKKFSEQEFYQVIKKYGTFFIINHLKQEREFSAKEALNLKLALLKHKGERIMNIEEMQENILEKIRTSDYKTLNSEEFFYLCGQISKYLLNQSKAGKKEADMLEPFLRAKNSQKLKEEIKFTFFKYKHELGLNHISFNNALALILAFDEDEKMNSDAFLIGNLSENIFYMKNPKKGEENE